MSNSVTQTVTKIKPVEFVPLQDGPHYDPVTGEYFIVVDGDVVAWASTQQAAWRSYNDMLHYEREHIERNPDNSQAIIFASFTFDAGQVAIWESCPECGRVRDVGEPCPECDIPFQGEPVFGGDDYGLEARF